MVKRWDVNGCFFDCMWLNKSFGDGHWICDGLLKPVNREICRKCKEGDKNA